MASVAKNMSRTKHSLAPLEMYVDLCLQGKDLEQMYHYLFSWVGNGKAPYTCAVEDEDCFKV